MKKGTTESGFNYQIEESNLDNMELIDMLAEVDGGNVSALPKATTMLLGKEQKEALYNHLRTDKGNVPVEAFTRELFEIIQSVGETGKKS